MRVLIAMEDNPFKEALVCALKQHRAHFEVRIADPTRKMLMQAIHLSAQSVIFDNSAASWAPRAIPGWVKVITPQSPSSAMFIGICGQERCLPRLGVEGLLALADEIEQRLL